MSRLSRSTKQASFVGLVAFAVLLASAYPGGGEASQLMATAPSLGSAASFAVLGGQTVTNTGPTTINGDLGVWPGLAITGFPPGALTGGTTHAGDAVAQKAQTDVTTAYNALAGQACDANLSGQDLGGKTLTPGVYCFSTSAQLTGDLTLNAGGNANAVFVFKIGSTLTTASNSRVLMINAGSPCNVFWQVGSSATLGTTTTFVGSILALTSITLNTRAGVSGRALARNGAVTMDTNNVTSGGCVGSTATSVPSTPAATTTPTSRATNTPPTAATSTPTGVATSVATPTVTAVLTSAPTGVGTSTTPTPAQPLVLPATGEPATPSYGWWIVMAGLILSITGFLFRRAGQRLR